jgi:hypothetical protein
LPELAAHYRLKDLLVVMKGINDAFLVVKIKLQPRDFCDIVTLFCLAGVLESKFFYDETMRMIVRKPEGFNHFDIINLLQISSMIERGD